MIRSQETSHQFEGGVKKWSAQTDEAHFSHKPKAQAHHSHKKRDLRVEGCHSCASTLHLPYAISLSRAAHLPFQTLGTVLNDEPCSLYRCIITLIYSGSSFFFCNVQQKETSIYILLFSEFFNKKRLCSRLSFGCYLFFYTYLQHLHTVSVDIEQRGKELKIHNNYNGKWKSVPFNHPASFDSVVLDPDLKTKIKHDLETFLKSKQYYHKLGRVWKRNYLLYGHSGTGKSSFIAAAANLLNYDVYNVNLSQVADEADLNSLLLQTTSKALIVVEDLDRYVAERSKMRITSSGLLNFMDGLLNSQDERIMIFTMNSKDGIDSALLRPGRIDMHIYFPMCDFNSFKNLANNYLGVKEHKLFPQVEEIFLSGATMSPAEISELMLVNRSSPSRALKSVISALQSNNRIGGKVAARLTDSVASSPAPPSISEDAGGAAWKEAMPKEFRKLYGLLRLKSCKKPGSFDHDSEVMER